MLALAWPDAAGVPAMNVVGEGLRTKFFVAVPCSNQNHRIFIVFLWLFELQKGHFQSLELTQSS